jgi:hypothetical protein
MTTLTLESHRRRMLFLFAGAALMIVVFFATRRVASFTDRVALDSFARCVSASGNSDHLSRAWLPAAEQVTEHLSHDEATAFAKDVFQSWVRKVHAAIPHELRSTT